MTPASRFRALFHLLPLLLFLGGCAASDALPWQTKRDGEPAAHPERGYRRPVSDPKTSRLPSDERLQALLQQFEGEFARLQELVTQIEKNRRFEEREIERQRTVLRELRNEVDSLRAAAAPSPAPAAGRLPAPAGLSSSPRPGPDVATATTFPILPPEEPSSAVSPVSPARAHGTERPPVSAPVLPAPIAPQIETSPVAPPVASTLAAAPLLPREESAAPVASPPVPSASAPSVTPPPVAAPPVAAPPVASAPLAPAPPRPAETASADRLPLIHREELPPPLPFPVERLEDATAGTILRVETAGATRIAILDIGSDAGLQVGSLISVRGVGPGYTLWQIVSVRETYSRAQPVPQQTRISGVAGDRAYQVRRAD